MSDYHDNASCINFYPANSDWSVCTTCRKPIRREGPSEHALKEQRKEQRARDHKARVARLATEAAEKIERRELAAIAKEKSLFPLFHQ